MKNINIDEQLADLRQQMAEMIILENFEQAEVLRDRIRVLEDKVGEAND